MKKLLFTSYITLIASGGFIIGSEQPTNVKKKPNPLKQSLVTRFKAFRQYLFAKTESTPTATSSNTASETSPIIPVIFYQPKKTAQETSRITLVDASNNDVPTTKDNVPSNSFDDVNWYNFSPKKQYLLVHQTRTEGAIARFGGDWFGKQAGVLDITKLINAKTQQEIHSFNGKFIMHEFSPDETTLLIAGPQKSWRERIGQTPDTKGASPAGSRLPRAGKRVQRPTGEILRYELFDITSKQVIKTFENIQSITYTSANELFVKYDNDTMETITIEKSPLLSPFRAIMNLFITQKSTPRIKSAQITIEKSTIRTEYDEKNNIFTLQIGKQQNKEYTQTISYDISPHKKYILIKQLSTTALASVEGGKKAATGETAPIRTTTTLVDLTRGKNIATFENVITYEFIPDEDESRLLILCTIPSTLLGMQYGSSDYLYRLYDTTKENSEIKQFDKTTQSVYFKSRTELIAIDKDGTSISYDAKTAITFEKEQQEKRKQINQAIIEKKHKEDAQKEQEAREQQKIVEENAKKEQIAQAALKEKTKEEKFATLSPKEQVALSRKDLPQSAIEKREAYLNPITAVRERGLAAVQQAGSEIFRDIKNYFWPTQTQEQPNTVEEAYNAVANNLDQIQQQEQQKQQKSTTENEDEESIEEIDSPGVQETKERELREKIKTLTQSVNTLDALISKQPSSEWQIWQDKQIALLDPVKPVLQQAIQQSIKNTWRENGAQILSVAIQATLAGTTSALITFAYQSAQIGTGNLAALDTNALIIPFLTSASAQLLTTLGQSLLTGPTAQTALSATGSNVLSQTLITPSIKPKSFQIKMPSFRGAIASWIVGEAIATVNTMLTQNGEITKAIKNINIKQILHGKELTTTSNALVSAVLPKVQAVIHNEKLALALTEIGWIFFQSAALGGLMWSVGFGYADTSMAESIGYSMLTGMAQGTLANLAALNDTTTPGAIFTISSVPLSQQIVSLTGSSIATTPESVITGIIQSVGTEATNFIVDEVEKSGGLLEVLTKGKNALGAAVSSRWSNIWGGISEVWETLQEMGEDDLGVPMV